MPIVVGRSVLYVRVLTDRPAVELFAELVVGVEDVGRAAQEVAILNRSHPVAKFCLRDDRVVMSYALHAWPFAPAQLRVAVRQLSEGLDDLARDVAARVRGQRFLDPVPDREAPSALVGLLELLYEGPAKPRLVAALFDNDRHQIIRTWSGSARGWTTRASTTSTSCWASCARRCATSPTTGRRPAGEGPARPGHRGPGSCPCSRRARTPSTPGAGHDLEESS